MMAFRNSETTMPVSTMVVLERLRSSRVAKPTTSTTVTSAKQRLTEGSRKTPRRPEDTPATMTSAAPRPAPAETPSPKGEASGLRSTDCITVPLTASPAPVRKAISTRGSRMLNTRLG